MSYQSIIDFWDEEERKDRASRRYDWRKLNRIEKWQFAHETLTEGVAQRRGDKQINAVLTHCRVVMESFWEYEQRPYYKISPACVDHLTRTELDEVPSDAFVLPSPRVLMIEVEKHPFFTDSAGVWLKYALIGMWNPEHPLADMRPQGWGIAKPTTIFDPTIGHVYCRFCLHDEEGFGGSSHLWMPLRPGETMKTALEGGLFAAMQVRAVEYSPENLCENSLKVYDRFLRLMTTFGFLAAANDPIIRPDVLEQYLDEYYDRATSEQRKNDILEKTRRKGRRGWLVGYDVGLQPLAEDACESGWGVASIRRGHVRTRKVNGEVVTKFVPPVSIRPDLPLSKESVMAANGTKTRPSTLTVTLMDRDKGYSAQANKCFEASRKILEKSVLPEFASSGEFFLKPRTQITQRSNRLWKPLRLNFQTIGLRIKPDNNNSCWEYDLILPRSVDAPYVFEEMKRVYEKTKSTLDVEEDAVVEKPAETIVKSFKDLPSAIAALPEPTPAKLAPKHPPGPYDRADPVADYAKALTAPSKTPQASPAAPQSTPTGESLLAKLQGIEGVVKAAQEAEARKLDRQNKLEALAEKRLDRQNKLEALAEKRLELEDAIAKLEEEEFRLMTEEENDVPAKEAAETLAALNRVLSMFK